MRADSVVPFGDCAPWEKISKSDARKLTKHAQGAPASPAAIAPGGSYLQASMSAWGSKAGASSLVVSLIGSFGAGCCR